MKFVRLLALTLLLPSAYALGIDGPEASLPADEVIRRAVERAEQTNRPDLESAYTFSWVSKSEKLDREGNPRDIEIRRYENVPYRGHSYPRLIEVDGRPLTPEEQREEAKRERKFREQVDKGESPDEPEERVRFDEDLVGRYDFVMRGLEPVGERWAYALAFSPKPGKLPVRRRIDRALNKSRGTLWIDRKTFEVAKLDFELTEKIGLWWGVIGSITAMRGSLEFRPVEENGWMPSRFELYINGRILFRSLHMNQTLTWSDFQKFVPVNRPGAP